MDVLLPHRGTLDVRMKPVVLAVNRPLHQRFAALLLLQNLSWAVRIQVRRVDLTEAALAADDNSAPYESPAVAEHAGL